MIAVRARIDHDEPAAPRVVLAHKREARGRLVVTLDDDVLKQLAQTRFDGAFVPAVDFEVIGNGTLLTDRMGPVARLANRRLLRDLEERYARLHGTLGKEKRRR